MRALFPPALRLALALVALFLGLLALVAVDWNPMVSMDHSVSRTMHRSAVTHHGWTQTNRVLTDWVWDPWTMRAMLALATGWLLWRGERLAALCVAATAVLGAVVQQAVKAAVGRQRPHWPDPVDSAHYAAFPSGHALTVTVAGGLLLWLLARFGARRRWRRAALTVALFSMAGVGFTRVYLGVHWPSDVVGGWLLGAALVAAVQGAHTVAEQRSSTVPEGQREQVSP